MNYYDPYILIDEMPPGKERDKIENAWRRVPKDILLETGHGRAAVYKPITVSPLVEGDVPPFDSSYEVLDFVERGMVSPDGRSCIAVTCGHVIVSISPR